MTKSLRRALRACGAALAALLLVTCTDNPIGPARPGLARLRVAPQFDAFARVAPLAMDRFTITVVRPPADTLARVTRSFSADSSAVSVPIDIFLQSTSETVDVTIELYAGSILLFRGTQSLTVTQGGSTPPSSIPVAYQGPGSQLASVTIGPRDTTVPFGATFAFGASAVDSQAAPVAQFYVAWSASGGTINGAGQFTAPAARDTVTVTAVTPTGVADSTTVIIAAAPATLVKASGDAQSGIIGSRLAAPLVVRVDGSDGLPVSGVAVTFAAATGGGSVDSAVVVSDGAGLASMGATLGTTVGAQSFTASAPGLATVTFTATGTGGGVRTWNGSAGTAWATAANWTPAAVPGVGDSVVIPAGTPSIPSITSAVSIGALVLQGTNATLNLNSTLTVSRGVALPDTNGALDAGGGSLTAGSVTIAGFQAFADLSLGAATVSGPVTISGDLAFMEVGPGSSVGPTTISGNSAFFSHFGGTQGAVSVSGAGFWEASGNVTVTGAPALSLAGTAFATGFGTGGRVTLNGDLVIGGTGAKLLPSIGDKWTINGNLSTTGGGTLVMNSAADTIDVNGNVTFGGGDETTSLTAGVLNVSGNFTQTGPGTTFIGSGAHTVFLDGAGAQTLNFAAPGFAAGRFQNVIIANSAGGVTATSDLYATGTAGVTPTAVRTLSGNGSTLFTTILNVRQFTFNNLLLDFAGSTVVAFDTVSFTGYAPTATPLTITHPGAAAALPFRSVSFSVTPTSGFYLDATDSNPSDGVPLVIDMLAPNPLSNGGRVATSNATVNWPAGVAPGTWTGAVSTAWTTAANWSDGQVPTATTDVTIPAGPANMPVLGTSTGIRNLTLQAGAALTLLNTMTLTLTGDLDDAGNLTSGGGGTQTIALTGAARTVRTTNIPNPVTVNVSGTYTLAGRMVVTDLVIGTGGGLALGGQTLVVTNLFNTTGSGTLTMTNPLDSVLVTGTANFGGGDETGLLTAGVLQVGGSLTQSGNAAALAAGGTHKTRLTGANPTLSVQSPGPGAGSSHLQELEWVGGGTLSLQNGLYVLGTTTLPAGGTLNGVSFTQALHTGLFANGAPVTFNNAQLWIEPGASVPVAIGNLIFTSGSSSRLYIRHPGLPAAAPLTLTNIAFTTVPPFPGVYLDVDDITPLDNNAVVVNLVNPTPAASGGLVNATNGAVVNWPAATPVFTWTGAVSGDWSVAGNWSTGSVPGATNDVFIPAATPNAPTLSATVAVDSLVLATSATVDLAGHFLQVFGDLDAPAGLIIGTPGVDRVILSGSGKRLSGASIGTDLVITGRTLLTGGTGVSGSVTVSDTLDFQTGTLLVSGDFLASGPAALLVQVAGGTLGVTGNATFDGPNQLGSLSNGVIAIGGNFTQLATNSPDSYHPSGTHQTLLNLQGPATTVTFATPGSVPGSSHFESLQLSASATHTVTLGSDVHAHGLLALTGPGTLTITGSDRLLSVGDVLQGTATVFDNVRLASTDVSGLLSFQQPLTFQNMNPTVTQLSLTSNGALPVTLTNPVFSTTPTGGGLYLSATDADGPTPSPFVVDLVNPTPATAGGFIQAINGAVINWPVAAGVITWTGASSIDWDTPANWSGGAVPGPTSDVVIPAGPANQPLIASSPTVHDLTVQAGAILGLGDVSITVTGTLDAPGLVQGCCTDVVEVLGTVRGNFSDVTFTVPAGATATLNGPVDLGTASSVDIFGELILAGHVLDAGQGPLNVGAGTGLLTMTNPADAVLAGNASFSGADQTGHLTAGTLQVLSLSQSGTVPTSFVAGGNHRVILAGPSPSSLFMANPASSRIQDLDVTGVSATLSLLSNVTVAGQLISIPSLSGPVVTGTGTLTAGGADLTATGSNTALTFDGVPLILSGGLISAFDHVAFANQNPVGTALTVNNVGQGTPFTFDALNFSTALSAGGFHLVANDLDGPSVPLVIDVVNSIPAAGSPFFQANNGAVVNWPPAAPVVTWTGAVSSDWFTPGNWSTGAVPALTDDVLIPAGPTNAPVLSGTATIRDLTVAAGAPTIEVASFALVVTGNLNSDGTILSTPATGGVTLSGFARQLRGTFDQATLLVNGDYSLSGRLVTTAGTGIAIQAPGALQLNGHTADVGGPFSTSAGGLLVMLNSLDSLLARGGAVFAGGDESAQLSAGVLVVTGDLIQSGGNPAAFAPSGSHKTVLNATAAGSVVFTNAPSSHLHLTEIAAPGGINLGSRAVATADVTVTQGQLDLGGNALVVGGNFSTSGTGTVRMVSPQDSIVAVNQTWAGGDPTGNITAGTIVATGSFIQGGTAAAPGFTAAGTNVVRLEGGASALTTVGSNLTTVFASLELATTGPLTVTGANTFNVDGTGTLQLLTPAPVTYNNGGRGALSFSGGTFTAVGSSVIAPSVELFPGSSIQGGWTVDTTMWNQGAALSLQVPKTIPYNHLVLRNGNNFFFDSGAWSIPGDLITRVVNAATVRLSDQSGIPTRLTVGGNTQIFGQFLVASGTLTTGSLDVATLAGSRGFLSMLSAADSVTVLGNANFNGGSTNGLLTAGVLRVNGNFTQGTGSSVAAFAPSGTHRTQLGAAAASTVSFASPGAGAAGSHFQVLDLSPATGGVTLLTAGTLADSVLATTAAAKLIGGGNGLTMRRSQISGLTVDNAPLTLDEQGVFSTENLSNILFQNFGPTNARVLTITGPGNSFAPRPAVTTNNVDFNSLGIGANNFYVTLTSTNSQAFSITMTGSSQSPQVGGNGPSLTQTIGGATVNWP